MLFPFSFKTYLFIRCLLGGSDISVIFALVQMSVWLLEFRQASILGRRVDSSSKVYFRVEVGL